MFILDSNTVKTWLHDKETFSHEFMEYAFRWHHAVGADITLKREVIEEAHAEWFDVVEEWKKVKFRQGAENLSYTKSFAILLWCLCKRRFCGEMREYAPFRKPAPEFPGSDELKADILRDLLGAPEVVTALEFCIGILNFFEQRRNDRNSAFAFRMTEGGRHDLIVALASDKMSAEAVFLVLESLYARD